SVSLKSVNGYVRGYGPNPPLAKLRKAVRGNFGIGRTRVTEQIHDELRRLELDKNTTVIFLSDHGYHLGDHDFWQKQNLHEQATRVPLLISSPGIPPAKCDSIVELTDIYPTVMDLVGLKTPDSCEGVSLKPVLTDPATKLRDFAFTFLGPKPYRRFSLRGNRWAFMKYEDGEELYDMHADYDQFHSLASDPKYQDEVVRLRAEVNRRAAVFSNSH
ncbi:MAG: sulfatase-like hydrolase/transferase, partial [Planctomycetota bacterium]